MFMTMLSLKDPFTHEVRMPMRRLCKKANLDVNPEKNLEIVQQLKCFWSRTRGALDHQEFEGRRLEVSADGEGWLAINGEKYRKEMGRLMSRAKKNQWQREARERPKSKRGLPLPVVRRRYLRARGGGGWAGAEAIAAEALGVGGNGGGGVAAVVSAPVTGP